MSGPRYRHLVLDRDGVLNREPERGWVFDLASWQWEPGAVEALVMLASAGLRVSVATNQSCIGRGVATAAQVDALHAEVCSQVARAGGRIDAIFVCPHAPEDGCACRKPAAGLLEQAVAAAGVPAAETLFVGDAPRDLEAGRAAGLAVALVRTGKGERTASEAAPDAVLVYDDLLAVARWVTRS
jgi:D-glycero-D-manno-heptose 1,7-bisphosphate phosphatase